MILDLFFLFRDDTIELLMDSTMALYVKYVRSWSGYQHYTRQIPGGQDLAKDLQDKWVPFQLDLWTSL